MKKTNLLQVIDVIKKLNKKITLLGVGPMSKTVIDASIESGIENDFPLFLLPAEIKLIIKNLGAAM
jgi:hypothetical protein